MLTNLGETQDSGIRKIIEIDEKKCNGCSLCIPNCAEGALQIVDGKVKLVGDVYCDGLGACLGHCPEDALRVIEREAVPFDMEAVHGLLASQEHPAACPSVSPFSLSASSPQRSERESALRHWPVQLKLMPTEAPRFHDADLLVVADCVPVAHPNFHASLLSGRTMAMGCPKQDNIVDYGEKLKEILKKNDVRSVTVATMEVPCCSGLSRVLDWAVEASGKAIPVRKYIVSVRGDMT